MFRKRKHLCFALTVVSVLLAAAGAQGADWAQWRGPHSDGKSAETGLLKKWPTGGPKLLWKAEGIGQGYSGVAIVGDVLYTMGNKDGKDGRETVFALDLGKRGAISWATDLGKAEYKSNYPGPRSTPTVDGDRLYVVGTMGRLVCLETGSGKIVWRKEYVDDWGGVVPRWGFAESPLIDGNLLICMPGGHKGSVVALDKMTGKEAWASTFGDKASYSSLIKVRHGGVEQYVGFSFEGVVGVAAADGNLLWRYNAPGHRADWGNVNVMNPVWFDGGVFASSGYKTGGGMATIVKAEDGFKAEEAWFSRGTMQNHHGGLILHNGDLYGCSDPREFKCIDFKTGKVKWESSQAGKCSVLYADGMLYCRDEKGPISLVKAAPDAFELCGQFDQPERSKEKAWPHLVIANACMYVRDQDILLCYDVKD